MKAILITVVLLVLGFIVLLPFYLGPDDISSCERPLERTDCQKADAIVVVSGGDTGARTDEGIRLYNNGWADTIIFSGAAADPKGPSNAEAMRRRALTQDVPDQAIIIEELSRTTTENAANTSEFIERNEISEIILVTSAYHQRRASLEFQYFLGDKVTITNHPVETDRQWPVLWWLQPESMFLALSEIVKIGLFYLRGPAGL